VGNFKLLFRKSPRGAEKTHETPQNTRCPDRESNPNILIFVLLERDKIFFGEQYKSIPEINLLSNYYEFSVFTG
jgi:hypothetical protein